MTIHTTELDTPVGPITLAERDGNVVALTWSDHFDRAAEQVRKRFPDDDFVDTDDLPCAASVQAYLDGDLDAIDGVPTDLDGTDFQKDVWATLRSIPAGETWSYARLASEVGRPNAFRAVGSANGRNPVWLVHPCHRVIAADGSLGGYGGGLDRKAWLLRHEGAI